MPGINFPTRQERFDELYKIAEEDGIEILPGSAEDCALFLESVRKPNGIFLNNGDFRCVWQTRKIRLSVEFLGGRQVLFSLTGEKEDVGYMNLDQTKTYLQNLKM